MHSCSNFCCFLCFSFLHSQAFEGFTAVPGNVEELASYIAHTVVIRDTYIEMQEGGENTKGIEFDLGVLDEGSTISVAVGFNAAHLKQHDGIPKVVIHDGFTVYNMVILTDKHYERLPPCRPLGAASADGRLVSPDSKVPGTYRITFVPGKGHAYCETAQDDGFIESGVYSTKLDMSQPIHLSIVRGMSGDKYLIHFIQVNVF